MNRREILNELQQIVALTQGADRLDYTEPRPCCCPEAAQRAKELIREAELWPAWFPSTPGHPSKSQQPTPPEPELPTEKHIDTLDELLELLAGISSDPQVEGLSLPQKASTMALLHIARGVQEIAYQLENIDTALEQIGIRISDAPVSQAEPLTIERARDLARKLLIRHATPTIQEIGELLVECDRHARQSAVESPNSPQEPS
jgi:hypothetical protein